MMWKKIALIGCIFLFCVTSAKLQNKKVLREIDISTNIARCTNTITLENEGSSAVTEFFFALPSSNSTNLASSFATQGDDELTITPAKPLDGAPAGATFYKVTLAAPLPETDEVEVEIETVFTGVIQPFPRELTQKDNQLAIFWDNLHFFSPYPTTEEVVTVNLASSTVEAHSPTEGAEVSESSIKYKEANDLEPYAFDLFMAHYQNNKPFVIAEDIQRTVQVSHWGALQVEEAYKIRHTGAKLVGPFSRLDLMRFGAPSSVSEVVAVLPTAAMDIYFRDVIGNISTSEIKEGKGTGSDDDVDEGKIEVKLTQRFPLFGGWKTEFYYGYNLPLDQNMNYTDDGKYRLSFPYAPPMKEMHTESLTINIILPEGASGITVSVAGKSVEPDVSTTVTNLDTAGRPTLTLRGTNIVSPDNEDVVVVEYSFDSSSLMQEPILLTIGFFCIFLTTMVVNWMFF
eukprot:NODE_97_length_1632_cov_475.971429_g95_i0.p1 GENE.NODE_97_length_1632_cov_475.971429_g95_i0~~NODE_97_length_1632_cov_475.971429_g95_i0.p1  ORF type:complete len:457 (+),score=122.17 NODE_97_length_1632_cov_475.971429_g95_i0:65-1435(+)